VPKTFSLILLLALAACSSLPHDHGSGSPCSVDQGSYQCEIQRYMST
jgi:hypothetical protein